MTMTDAISFLVAKLVEFLSAPVIFPFVGVILAGFVIKLVFYILYGGKKAWKI